MNPRELTVELQRLRQMVRSLLAAIESLQTRAETIESTRTIPPPARPTTRLKRATKSLTNVPVVSTNLDEVEPPSTRPGAGSGGTYRHVSPKKR
jgi:hypothetical protein